MPGCRRYPLPACRVQRRELHSERDSGALAVSANSPALPTVHSSIRAKTHSLIRSRGFPHGLPVTPHPPRRAYGHDLPSPKFAVRVGRASWPVRFSVCHTPNFLDFSSPDIHPRGTADECDETAYSIGRATLGCSKIVAHAKLSMRRDASHSAICTIQRQRPSQ